MENVLITGAGGLVGSHLVPLLARDRQVFALGRSAGPAAPNVTWIEADLARPLDLDVLPGRIDAIVYLAQSNRFREFPGGAPDMFQVNVAQPLALLEWGRRAGARSFVYASTGSVYAPSPDTIHEDAPTPANGFYASSKLAAELFLRSYSALLPTIALRYFFVYGSGQNSSMLIPRLTTSVREGRVVALQGAQGMRIRPTHATDAAEAVRAALQLEGSHTINVSGGETLSIREICELAGVGLEREPLFEVDETAEPAHFIPDTTLMERLLGPARIPFALGVRDLL